MPVCRAVAVLLIALPAHAVIVRGRVSTPLGAPLPGARIQLISLSAGPRNAASTISGPDGEYEIQTDLAGRFLLLTAPSPMTPIFAPQIGLPFYAGRTDLLTREIVLDLSAITPQLTSQPTLVPTPLAQLSATTTQIAADQLLTDATPLPAIAQTPGAFLLQLGQVGTPATLYLRGAPLTSTTIDGVTAQPLGAPYNLASLTTSGLSAIASTPAVEITPTPNPLRFLDAQAGTLALTTALAQTLHPALTYAGDAGSLSTTRNEAILSATHTRADALASFARFDTDNDQPAAPLHLITYAANLGYHISPETSLRLTLRQDVTATPLALPFAIYGLQPAGREAAQNLVAGLTYETRTAGNWHNLLRYSLLRQRAQQMRYTSPATGLPVTIFGANGYSAAGTASFAAAPTRGDQAINRDEYTYQTDYPIRRAANTGVLALFTARYQDERVLDRQAFPLVTTRTTLERTHLSFAGSLQAQLRHRLFAQASGFIDSSDLFGLRGTPRLGLTWVPVRPGSRRLRGTALHLTLGSGLREPALAEQIATSSPQIAHARTLDFGIDQSIFAQKLTLRATYFHNQFSHQSEPLSLSPLILANTLAYRTQGAESALHYQPFPRVSLSSAYTYLAALVEQSSTTPNFNPSLPAIPIGALTALPGSRPFHRPPHSGSFAVEYTGSALTAMLRGNFASRSDDSTNLAQNPNLLLPNHNLSPGFFVLDASATYALSHRITLYTQFNNLLNDRTIAPVGYRSTPFQVRAGLRFHLGGE